MNLKDDTISLGVKNMLYNGLYEKVINKGLDTELASSTDKLSQTAPIDSAEASKVLAKYIAEVVEKGLENVKDNGGDLNSQVELANRIIGTILSETKEADFDTLSVAERAEQLLALFDKKNSALALDEKAEIIRPETSIAQSSLFTGAIHEPQMFTELKKEIVTCDRIDMLVSFIKWSGLRLMMDELRTFTQNGGNLRIITTSYKKKLTTKSSREELVEKAKTLFAKKPDFLSEITIPNAAPLCEIETNEIWGKVIIGTHKVIVVDDPICSLDSSILYVVSSLVRELTDCAKNGKNNIDQVFILTHNVYFHKEVSFMDGRNQTDNKVSFWTLHKKNEISTVKSYNNKNPITTSYALLWKEIKNSDSLSSVSLQNAMRRILENFFGTLGNANLGDILRCFDSPEEQSICRSLFSWANDGSHSIPDDLEFCEDNDSSEKFKKVFKDVFYNTNNQYHYDRMME